MPYTKAEKEVLIKYIRDKFDKKVRTLNEESERIAQVCENKVLRRLNSVSVTLYNIKLKDVLEIERQHKPTIKNLLKDIQQLRETSSSNNNSNISLGIRNSSRNISAGKITKQ